MFKKLKEKITEEVKISPQRFQQLTQSVSDKLQGTSAPEDNMFSIGEDDEHSSSMNTDQGFSSVNLVSPYSDNRSRRLSSSSMASDISFLPRYEAGSTYHLQSDLDVSASELEDNVSQSSSQLGHLSKEQIYSAFQKSQMRYHKYRGRYTDLARHYQELERENSKMKSVLVETQDKAIRRVNELKEQCTLEQKAKAHLESALRDELDEKQMKIQSLQTKINLMHPGQNNTEGLVDLDQKETINSIDPDKLEQLTKYLNDARSEIETLNKKIQEYKASAIVFQSKEQEYKTKIANLEKDIASFSEREKENNIKLAENKMELHNELLSKDSEINKLRKEIESLRSAVNMQDKDSRSAKIENLQTQNSKLIERLENVTQKCNSLENELLKVEKYKMDIRELNENNLRLSKKLEDKNAESGKVQELLEENSQLQNIIGGLKNGLSACQENLKTIAEEKQYLIETIQKEKQDYDKQLHELRESAKKGLFTLEKQISERVNQNYKEKETALKEEFEHKLRELTSNNQTTSELQLQIVKLDEIIKELNMELQNVQKRLEEKENQHRELENNHLELIEECNQLRKDIDNLEKQVCDDGTENNKVNEEKIGRLQANIKTLQDELCQIKTMCEEKEKHNVQLAKDNLNLETVNTELSQKYRLLEEKQEAADLQITENNLLEMKLQALEEEKKSLLEGFEAERKLFNKIMAEHKELKIKEVTISELEQRNQQLEEQVVRLKGYLKEKEDTIVDVSKTRLKLEQDLSKAQESIRILEERQEAIEIDRTECNLLQIKVQQLENEKENMVKSFQKERETFDHSFHKKNEEFESHKEDILKENVSLAKEVLELKKVNDDLITKVRLFEEKEQVMELETSESNLLKLKLQELEKEKDGILSSVKAERQMFNKILEEHKELKVNEEKIKGLEGTIENLTQKVATLKGYLKEKEDVIVKLQKECLNLEQQVSKLNESLRIKEEQIDALDIEKTECGLLELKIKTLEEEKQNLLESFEMERSTFGDALSKGSHLESIVDALNQKVTSINQQKESLEKTYEIEKQSLIESFETERKNFHRINTELKKISQENILLKEDKENLNNRLREESDMLSGQINLLKEEVERLQATNEKLRKELDIRQERLDETTSALAQLQKDAEHSENKYKSLAETLNKEKREKKEALKKINDMQQELDKNNSEINEIKKALESVDKLYNEAKMKQSNDGQVVEETKKKLVEVEKQKLALENELATKSEEYKFKVKEMSIIEQQFSGLTQDKDNLTQENRQLKERLDEWVAKFDSLQSLQPKVKELEQVKKQNEVLQKECDRLNQEISELNVRLNQLASDNRNINEEHDKIVTEMEEYKIRCELLENEKGQYARSRSELEKERDNLRNSVDELTQRLEKSRMDLENKTEEPNIPPTSNNVDLVQIQRDFLDIKDQCDKLHVENKNLKVEYAKLEEQYTTFAKVKKDLESQLTELERHYNEVLHEKQLLQDEVQELKISPINSNGSHSNSSSNSKTENIFIKKQDNSLSASQHSPNGPLNDVERLQTEIEHLRDKVIQYKSLDITNKSSIEFYENELQKMKNKNEKLNRKLDETLVTLNHCAELSGSTEIEYLRNVLYNYMLGKESLVLARVIAAVCKFDPVQTETVLQKEQQKQTLLGQLGIL